MRKHKTGRILKKTVTYTVLLSCLSTNILMASMSAYAAGAHVDVDETMYLNLDYYGTVSKANVVKGINFNGVESYTDFGNYIDITNMSDAQKPDFKNGKVTWNKYDGGKFYFQGTLKPESVEVPWKFDITYKLNGVVIDADKIAGQSGLVEMDIDAYPNKNASEYMRNNMMLIVTVPVDVQKCYSVDAPNSQTSTLGQYTAIVFEALPGKEGHFEIRLGTDSFETVGAIFMMSPGTVGDLSKIKDIKKIKDDFRDDTNAMMDDFEDVLDGVTNVQSQLDLTNRMLANLQSGKDKLHNNAQVIFNGNDVAIQDLRNLQGTLEPLNEDLKTTQWMVYDINSNLNTMDSHLMDASTKLNTLNKRLKQLGNSMSGTSLSNLDIQDLNDDASKAIDSLNDVVTGVNSMTNNTTKNREQISASASEIITDATLDSTADNRGYDKLSDKEKSLISAVSQVMGDVSSIDTGSLAAILAVANTNAAGVSSDSDEEKAKYIAYVSTHSDELKDLAAKKQDATMKVTALQTALQTVSEKLADPTTEEAEKAVLQAKIAEYQDGLQKISEATKASAAQATQEAEDAGLKIDKVQVYAKVMTGDEATANAGNASKYSGSLNSLLSLKKNTKSLVNNNIASDKEMDSLSDSLQSLTDAISNLEDENGDLFSSDSTEELISSINNVISDLDDIMDDGGAVAFQTARTLNTVRSTITDIDALIGIMNAYYEDVQRTFEDSENVITELEKTTGNASIALQNVNNVLRSAEPDFSSAADEGLEIGRKAVDNTQDVVDSTKHLKDTGRKLRNTINDKLDEEEEDNNFLNMDPDAPKVSLTSKDNQEPTSISIVCRSEEISVDNKDEKVLDSEIPDAGSTFIQRLKAVFLRMWNGIKAIFGN
ncbi:hypothetical protein [Oribacterium sp. WCC10]|uniref:hypothetical protein n=1 Tax=Oribacterium sp. WCC10 TaxID=1855343 RepID=UPI0008E0A3EA|nr:hypothetical protein [Oribacterium sp. WCC10]SFG12778.1 hypothetical protein SAMN05216356_10226 [Oribacterium sp. WCC10]